MAKTERVRKPTRVQKEIMVAAGLDWNVYEEDNVSIKVISKKGKRRRVLHK